MVKALFHRRRRMASRVAGLGAVALVPALAAGVAFAAATTVTPRRLTVFEAASQVPWTTCTLAQPVADAYVDAAALSAGSNFGTLATMTVRSDAAGNRRAFVRFDLSGCSMPQSAVIQSAALQVYLQTAPSASRSYQLHRVTAAWAEATVTSTNQPAVSGTSSGTVSSGNQSGVTLQWNVLADVQAYVAGTAVNNGWRLSDTVESALSAQTGTFATRENPTPTRRPQLVVVFRR
jgi:hypothetical protein